MKSFDIINTKEVTKLVEVKEKVKERKQVRLELVYRYGTITLIAVDEDGYQIKGGNLLTFNSDGTIVLHSDINRDIGLKLDDDGTIIIS